MLRDCSADKKGEDVSASSSFFCKPKFVHDVCPALQRRTGVSHKQGRAPVLYFYSLGLYFISHCCKAAMTQTMGSLWGYKRVATVMSC